MIYKQDILEIVCSYYGLDFNLLLGKSRKSNIVKARQIYCYFCRILTNDSLAKIAKIINKDHATVMHSVKKLKNEMDVYPKLSTEITLIYGIIMSKSASQNSLIPKNIDLLAMTESYTNSFIRTL